MRPPDVVIVGAGVQGASMALAAARKGLRPMVIERDRPGAGASGGSYGIVHGGLRYLQTMDVKRWRRSRRAQAWYLSHFPRFVRPLPCVMPLYRRCLRSPAAFRLAASAEAALTRAMKMKLDLPALRIIAPGEVLARFPVPPDDLTGAALWHDAEVADMPGLVEAMLAEAGAEGEMLLTRTEALDVVVDGGRVTGLRVAERDGSGARVIETGVVINCGGSWSSAWRGDPAAPSTAALAFNLVLDLEFPDSAALAVSETPGKGRSYFLRRHAEGGTFAGTFYRPAPGAREPSVAREDVDAFRNVLERTMPGFGLAQAPVRQVLAGLLPDKNGQGTALSAADHHRIGDPAGYHSVLGGKLTTAPLLSLDVADRIWPNAKRA